MIAFPVHAETVIAALGDSLTQGYGLPRGEGFVPQLEAWLLREGADVRVLNAGVSGDTTAGGLSRVDWTLTEDVDAMIVALGGNDMLRGLDPETARSNLEGILEAASEKEVEVLLVGLAAPGNYGPDYKQEFDAIYPELASKHGTLLFPDMFSPLRTAGTEDSLARNMQSDGIHPSAEGVALIVEEIGPAVLDLVGRAGSP